MNQVSVRDIIAATSSHYRISVKEFLSKTRRREIAWPRQVAMYLTQKITERSTPEIGGYFRGVDHTTVLYSIKSVNKRLIDPDYGPELNADIKSIIEDLYLSIPETQVFTYRYKPAIVKVEPVKLEPEPEPAKVQLNDRKCLAVDCGKTFTPESRFQYMCLYKPCLKIRRNVA